MPPSDRDKGAGDAGNDLPEDLPAELLWIIQEHSDRREEVLRTWREGRIRWRWTRARPSELGPEEQAAARKWNRAIRNAPGYRRGRPATDDELLGQLPPETAASLQGEDRAQTLALLREQDDDLRRLARADRRRRLTLFALALLLTGLLAAGLWKILRAPRWDGRRYVDAPALGSDDGACC
jgi:hypothetical protein